MQNKRSLLADAGLLAVAVIWGAGFAATQYAIDAGLDSAMILLLRFTVAALALLIVCFKQVRTLNFSEVKWGALAGLFLFLGFFFQVEAQSHSTPSGCAFLTTTNVLMVPLISWAVTRKRPELKNLLLPLLAGAGIFVLSFKPGQGFSFGVGEVLALCGAFFFACQIIALDFASKKVESRKLTFMQMITAAVLALVYTLAAGGGLPSAGALRVGALPVLYLGLMSTCLCFFLQTAAQKYADATKAVIFLSMEGVFGSLFSVMLGLEPFTWMLGVGGSVLFLSAVLTEVKLPAIKKRA